MGDLDDDFREGYGLIPSALTTVPKYLTELHSSGHSINKALLCKTLGDNAYPIRLMSTCMQTNTSQDDDN